MDREIPSRGELEERLGDLDLSKMSPDEQKEKYAPLGRKLFNLGTSAPEAIRESLHREIESLIATVGETPMAQMSNLIEKKYESGELTLDEQFEFINEMHRILRGEKTKKNQKLIELKRKIGECGK